VDRMLPLDATDGEELGLVMRDAMADADKTSSYDDITHGQARIMAGNAGLEDWQLVATTYCAHPIQDRYIDL
jgi:hypothetical protein